MCKTEILITILTLANILLATIMMKTNTEQAKENAELLQKNIWQAEKIKELINAKDKSIVEERTIETENITY